MELKYLIPQIVHTIGFVYFSSIHLRILRYFCCSVIFVAILIFSYLIKATIFSLFFNRIIYNLSFFFKLFSPLTMFLWSILHFLYKPLNFV